MSGDLGIREVRSLLLTFQFTPLVRSNNVCHDLVPNDISTAELDERKTVDAGQSLFEGGEATLTVRYVNLSRIAGDYNPRSKSDASQKHFHLFWRGVLCLVQNDESCCSMSGRA